MFTVDNLRVHVYPSGCALQQRAPGQDWQSLRALQIGPRTCYLVGRPASWNLYDADVLVPHVLRHEFNPDTPLPPPLDAPPEITTLDPDPLLFLVQYATGRKTDALQEEMGLDTAKLAAYGLLINGAGVRPIAHSVMKTALQKHLMSYKMTVTEAADAIRETAQMLDGADPTSPTGPMNPDATPRTTSQRAPVLSIGPIERTTPEEERVLLQRHMAVTPTERIRWPFSKMRPGDNVKIAAPLAAKAQRAAHVYATRRAIRFQTSRNKKTGEVTIYCVARMPGVDGTDFTINRDTSTDTEKIT